MTNSEFHRSAESESVALREKMLGAEDRGNRCLADANEALERGDKAKAEKLFAKGQHWLDRYNNLAGNS